MGNEQKEEKLNNENEVNKINYLYNEQKHPKQTMWIRWITAVITSISAIFAIIISCISISTVNEVKETIKNQQEQNQSQVQSLENEIKNIQSLYQSQNQELINKLTTIQEQYQIMQNILNQEQTVDVIQARDNDVLIRTPDEKWIVVPMIENNDISFSNQIIEKQYNNGESSLDRVDLFNDNLEDWSARDSFTYTIPYISINQNKMVSLSQFINSMAIEFRFYKNDKITYISDTYKFYSKELDYPYLNVFENISTNKQYVTKELDDGIEDIKINIIIEFEIGGTKFSIPYTYDIWLTVNQDF